MFKMIATEFCTDHGNAPFFLRRLRDLNPAAKRIVMLYLRWKVGSLSHADIASMLESSRVSKEDLEFYAGQLD